MDEEPGRALLEPAAPLTSKQSILVAQMSVRTMQYRVVVVQPNESAIFLTTRASDVKTRVLKKLV